MVDVFRFEKDGVLYAKGFYNQEGLTFYVLSEYVENFHEAVDGPLQMIAPFYLEEVDVLPGEPESDDG